MTKGPNRIVLDQYLDTASEGRIKGAGISWKSKAKDLKTLGDALGRAAQQAELRIGEQTLTGPALRAGMEKSSQSLITKSEQLHAAGEALSQVGAQLSDARDQRDALTDLGEKPRVYQAPAGTPGVEPTPEEIQAQAAASQARQNERSAWQSEYDKQEARSLALTREMDAAFLGAIPPMKEIHGEKDPTEPPPNVPSGPGGTYLPGTQAPPATGGGGGGNTGSGVTGGLISVGNDGDSDGNGGKDKPTPPVITTPPTTINETPTTTTTPTTPTHVSTESPTSTVTGTSQNGIAYQPSGAQASAPTGATLGSPGATAAALGAAGGAGGLAAGAVRPGAVPSSASGSTPVRAIGSTGRAGSAGALSRSAAAGSSAARSAATTGSPASRSAGSAAGRGAAAGGAAGRGGAGSRGAAGSTSGSRSGARGSSGARGAGAGAGSTGGRSGRKGERDRTTDRDSLVYDQDWLGDDDVAPGVLD